MSISKQRACELAITELRRTIPERLEALDKQFMEVLDSRGHCDAADQYAEAMTDLVFDVIENAIFAHTDNAEGLEAFKERLEKAAQTLDIAISVVTGREYSSVDWHRQFDEMMDHHHH